MTYFLYSGISFIVLVLIITGAVFWTKSLQYSDATTESLCDAKLDKNNKKCGTWIDKICWKSTFDTKDQKCTKHSGIVGLILFGLGIVLSFIAFIVCTYKGFKNKSSSSNFAYHVGSSCGSSQ